MFEHKIYCDGKLIAEFLHSTDRDYCIELLKEKYEDCEFSREDTNK